MMKRLRISADELDRTKLAELPAALGCTPISEIADRQLVEVVGRIGSIRIVPRAGAPVLEVNVEDGHGRAVAVFYGRRQIAGLHTGRTIRLAGRVRSHRGRTTLINPGYELLS